VHELGAEGRGSKGTGWCGHYRVPVRFPDGTTVWASGHFAAPEKREPVDLGLYLYEGWEPTASDRTIEWPDFDVPLDARAARAVIREAFDLARSGKKVEVGCAAGHGRTGTVLACMAILAGVSPNEAVEWVRQHYCSNAVEHEDQEVWVLRFATP
jgi:protein-tyrosine phosphatase